MLYNALQRTATQCNTLLHIAAHCNTLQHTATHCNTMPYTATHCNTLQHAATRCNTLQLVREEAVALLSRGAADSYNEAVGKIPKDCISQMDESCHIGMSHDTYE